ncbi:hypothetical protein ACLB2K_048746 [Fragaria x ananassa]
MARGTLDVRICGGRNLSNPNKEGKICCIVYYKDQQKRTEAIYCDGPDPEWNETLLFTIADHVEELKVRVHDGDYVTEEEVGHCDINIEGLLRDGGENRIEPTSYDVWRNNEGNYGNVTVELHFHPGNFGLINDDDRLRTYVKMIWWMKIKNKQTSTYCFVI